MIAKNFSDSKSLLLAAFVSSVLSLSACQPQSSTGDSADPTETVTQADLPAKKSDSASAQIAKYQPVFVTQMQNLQRRLQAEFESLEAADSADDLGQVTPTDTNTALANANLDNKAALNSDKVADTKAVDARATEDQASTETNISTEVGERDLELLKRVTLSPKAPKLLPEDELISRYQSALNALYEPESKDLSAEQIDTLLNIAATIPELFDNLEIAERLTLKSPALGRLVVQYQVWQQIESQQAEDIETMKAAQKKEFDNLVSKFNETIKGYDEQIAQYEKTLQSIKK